ncbi:PREDICTED: uncharacterized protein LOC109587116 [Amphimedon queenslandica]|nr:PREDICTED: uncharacterized protein LOC109587116 [Amphimedon queenslandica]|eukprot:XP_019858907.1 PREDICTED: uncharacterized protein LOC109587116 [Amphimedon queenslandica]
MSNGPEQQQQEALEFQETEDTAPRTTQMNSNDNIEFAVFYEYKDRLADNLVFSLSDLALRAAGKKLIASAAAVSADKVGKTTTQKERATFLIGMVMNKMDRNLQEAAYVMQKFLESIDKHAQLHKFLSKKYEEIRNQMTQPEKEILKSLQAQIALNLEFDLNSVAGKLLKSGIITPAQHKVLINPAARFEDLAIDKVLDEIGALIKTEKRNFQVFVDDVLEEIGGPAETLAEKMRVSLGDNLSQAPPYPSPAPSYSSLAPSYSSLAPSYSSLAPSYSSPAPSYSGQPPPHPSSVTPDSDSDESESIDIN